MQKPDNNEFVKKLYDQWLNHESHEEVKRNLHTTYHEVEKITNGLTIKW